MLLFIYTKGNKSLIFFCFDCHSYCSNEMNEAQKAISRNQLEAEELSEEQQQQYNLLQGGSGIVNTRISDRENEVFSLCQDL